MDSPQLSIITINLNNAAGLKQTLQSVAQQTRNDFEHIIVDGASTDDSVDIIRAYEQQIPNMRWLSEPDQGIYNAMNKGIRMATGTYIQILNSGDMLASSDVTKRMMDALEQNGCPSILCGNTIKCFPDGRRLLDRCFASEEITLIGLYYGSLNHNAMYIRHDLFDQYGYYDEELKIVSDWKWFLHAIILGQEQPKYTDIDLTLFDMTGISEQPENRSLIRAERRKTLTEMFPATVLHDYDRYANDIYAMRRLRRHPWAYKAVHLLERILFKLEKSSHRNVTQWE